MYNNILHKSPVLKPNVSNSGRELLEGLLQKDRTQRLGVKDDFVSVHSCFFLRNTWHKERTVQDMCCSFLKFFYQPANLETSFFLQLELKYHSFFSPINWEDLMAKKITPPFIPSVVSSNPGLDPLFSVYSTFSTGGTQAPSSGTWRNPTTMIGNEICQSQSIVRSSNPINQKLIYIQFSVIRDKTSKYAHLRRQNQ